MPIYNEDAMLGAQSQLKAAMPKGWMTLGPLSKDVTLNGREPRETWQLRVQWGTEIEGGRTVYYGDITKTGIEKSGRRIEVTLIAASVDELVVALRAIPVRGLEAMASLRWPTEFVIESVLVP